MDRIHEIKSRINQIETAFNPGKAEKEVDFQDLLKQAQGSTIRIDGLSYTQPQMGPMMMPGGPMMPVSPMAKASPYPPQQPNSLGYINPCPTGKLSPYAADDGLDIHAPQGTPVVCAKAGVVVYNDADGHSAWEGPGNDTGAIRIKHADGTEAWYAHLSGRNLDLKPGDFVPAGTYIGNVGTANNVPHLHMSIFYSSGGDAGGFMGPFEMEAMYKEQQNTGAYAYNQNQMMNPMIYGMNQMNSMYTMNQMNPMMNPYGINQSALNQISMDHGQEQDQG